MIGVATFVAVTGIHADIGPVSALGLAAFAGLLSMIVGGVLAVVSMLRRHERSIYVLASVPLSALALFIVVGELAVPH
ncbi:MAG TPA: hypothetical protein VI408_07360 [Gaiellaceae bacterium]